MRYLGESLDKCGTCDTNEHQGAKMEFTLNLNSIINYLVLCRCMKLLYRVEGMSARAILKKYIGAPSTEVINISREVALRILLGGGY
jgi:hypothetical protein